MHARTYSHAVVASHFTSLLLGAPRIDVEGFAYPVTEHYLEDVLELTGYAVADSFRVSIFFVFVVVFCCCFVVVVFVCFCSVIMQHYSL
jgi:hypothetical protein